MTTCGMKMADDVDVRRRLLPRDEDVIVRSERVVMILGSVLP